MKLRRPAKTRIFAGCEQHEGGLELHLLFPADPLSAKAFCKNLLQIFIRFRNAHHIFQRMVTGTAAHFREERHSLLQRFLQIGKASDFHSGRFAQLFQIVCVIRLFQVHGLVRSPCGKHLYLKALILRDLLMPSQIIGRVIRGTHQRHAGLTDQIADTHAVLMKLLIAEIPDFLRSLTVQHTGIAEKALQLQMAPVKERIADSELQRFRPLLKLLPVRRVSGDIVLLHTVGTHGTPFIMVPSQPYLCDVVKLSVLRDLLRIDVTVIVQNRHIFRICMEKLLRRLRTQ